MKIISVSQARRQFGAKRLAAVGDDGEVEIQDADWGESVHEILARVDQQLQVLGFEIVLHDTGDDSYVWHIGRLPVPARKGT